MRALKRIAVLLISAVFVVLALANTQPVTLHAPLFPEIAVDIPLYLLFFFAMALGVFLSGITGLGRNLKHACASHHSRKDIKKLEHEVALLRTDARIKGQVGK